jgi:hypothetical protein
MSFSRRLTLALGPLVPASLLLAPNAFAQAVDDKPAGGAETFQVVLATAGAMVATTLLFALGLAHRSGRTNLLRWGASKAARITGLPYWAALPVELLGASLLCAVFGMYWDISLHIDNGRDAGPLANPAHYFILIGLFGVFAAGFLACVLPEERPSRAAVKLGDGWYAPVGGIVLLACGAFALIGFPLDDFWHRLFGQDVTLWGPTHLMLIGGAGLTLVGYAVLLVEGKVSKASDALMRSPLGRLVRMRHALVMGGLLIGLSTFQGEYDFGVPQFRLVFHPILIAFAAGVALVAARIYGGRGAALAAAAMFIAVRGGLALIVGPVLGQTAAHFPLFVAEALLVEAVALFISIKRPYLLGAVSGALIATLGFAAEFGWSQVFFKTPWPGVLIEESLLVVPITAIAAGLLGAFLGSALSAARWPAEFRLPAVAPAALSVVAIAAVVGYGLQTTPESGVRASVQLEEVAPAPERTVNATVRVEPAAATKDADYVSAISWQGRGFELSELERTGPGSFRTTEPIPVHGTWKTMVRLHRRDSLIGLPIYLPEDTAIPAEGVPAERSFTRSFVEEHEILQREQKDDVPAAVTPLAYGIVGSIVLALLLALGWALTRLGRTAGAPPPPEAPPARPTSAATLGRARPA